VSNQVYANNMEVSCKQAAGKSICAFPDVCFTPPLTPATPPGVPIPYPNTGMASDTSDGSSSVKISGQEVMLKNKSCFKKSMGDEAGAAPKKGVVTSKNMGKVYFNAWSMDVKVEGENVVRMLDLTTHNHASMPGNSPTWPYIDEAAFALDSDHPCADVAKELETNCKKHLTDFKSGPSAAKVNRAASKGKMCADKKCKKAMKCVLSPYKPSNCCKGPDGKKMTPHHVVPAHCFMPKGTRGSGGSDRYAGCEGYADAEAPCVCVTGKDKSAGDHKKIHDKFDDVEDKRMKKLPSGKFTAGSWSYSEAADEGSKAVSEVTGCDEGCLRAQLDEYHQQAGGSPNIKDSTPLRADSGGSRTPGDFVPSKTRRGSIR
jgi:Domain of unknown function (DUF4150)/GHH signature containing HNH/Endo VII superfamily nuclease toxin  2